MKKIFLAAVLFVIVSSSVGVTAQTIFIPQPPVVHIPLLNPAAMHIRNQRFTEKRNCRFRAVNSERKKPCAETCG